ncbi:hypothetical protein NQ318_002031 [Aromia moschata]|uniref:Peptidase S1 domain-containing protein n=1 Tax=Aromia moschata TaxID=1265417 RepID=A0AAV8Z1W3_9CUCU|nr:hypothetical protein NQ318_002031 [Aromia moschata]
MTVSLETSDVLIKGGEWKLGIDEEPLPFQIVKVAAILRHPGYKPGSYENDLAVLVLHEKLRMTKNVGTICLPQPNQAPAPASKCVVTGWGKRILQLHAKGAIMHHIDVALMDGQECQQTLTQKSQNALQLYNPTTLCGVSNTDHCKVDYGSALACSDDQQHYTLHGIYTWDTGCGQDGQVGGYITPDIEWIDSIMARPLKQLKRIEKEYLLNKG